MSQMRALLRWPRSAFVLTGLLVVVAAWVMTERKGRPEAGVADVVELLGITDGGLRAVLVFRPSPCLACAAEIQDFANSSAQVRPDVQAILVFLGADSTQADRILRDAEARLEYAVIQAKDVTRNIAKMKSPTRILLRGRAVLEVYHGSSTSFSYWESVKKRARTQGS